MVKKQTYKPGDILEIPLNEHVTGYARILYKKVDTLILECFDVKREKVVVSIRCWNDNVKNGKWKVIDYEEIPKQYKYPDFYGQLAITEKYYKIKGEDILKGVDHELASRIVIHEKEISGMNDDGIHGPELFIEEYLERLTGGNH